MKEFRFSIVVTVLCLLGAALWGARSGMGAGAAVLLALILGVMEVSLSFDNAVINASVLREMDEKWQRMFLTVGIFVAVFLMRLVFPITIVALATGLPMLEVSEMALSRPDEYAHHLHAHFTEIAAFGGMFLLLVFLKFFIDRHKTVHWLQPIESRLARLGKLDSAELLVALIVLFLLETYLPLSDVQRLSLLVAGVAGIITYGLVSNLDCLFADEEAGDAVVGAAKRSGFAAFLYLEVVDASFSFDGVVGAFAITRDLIIIMLGLGIGAIFVRSLTLYLVRKGTLEQYVFLEHGAHYGIGALAFIMLIGIVHHVSEVVTGLIGVAFIVLSVLSSLRQHRH
jgi:hypothetical protein